MPGGTSWSRYLTFVASSIAAMFAGASVVHYYYKPNLEIPTESQSLADKEGGSLVSLKSYEDVRAKT